MSLVNFLVSCDFQNDTRIYITRYTLYVSNLSKIHLSRLEFVYCYVSRSKLNLSEIPTNFKKTLPSNVT
jgi:hypothetical protein